MRLAVLSATAMDPSVNSTTWNQLEEALADEPGSTLLRPPGRVSPFLRRTVPAWLDAIRQVRRADAVFWLQLRSHPYFALWALGYARPSAVRSAYILDAWSYVLPQLRRLAQLQNVNPCFVAFKEAHQVLEATRAGSQFHHLPFAADSTVFHDRGTTERPVFAYWMGRRYQPLHLRLNAYCDERDLKYDFSRRSAEEPDPQALGRRVARAKFFVVTPPDLDNPERTGGFSPLVMRYFEGLAAGATLLGVKPRSGEYDEFLPPDAFVEVEANGSDLEMKLDAALSNADLAAATVRGRDLVARSHTWAIRAQEVRQEIERQLR